MDTNDTNTNDIIDYRTVCPECGGNMTFEDLEDRYVCDCCD